MLDAEEGVYLRYTTSRAVSMRIDPLVGLQKSLARI